MRTNLAKIAARAQLNIEERGSTVVIRWIELTGGTIDAPTGERVGATKEEKSNEIKAMVHFVSPATTGFRLYNEIQIGDAILDMNPTVEIDGKQDLRFEFADGIWVQKELGKELTKAWDTMWGDQKLVRSVLVRKHGEPSITPD